MSDPWRKSAWWGGGVILAVGAVAAGVGLTAARKDEGGGRKEESRHYSSPSTHVHASGRRAIPVKTIRPKKDPSFTLSVEEPASVEAYFQADLLARVAGPVKFIAKDIGAPVSRGELLLEIDVPDLWEAVAQKQALLTQQQRAVAYAQEQVRVAAAAVKAAADQVAENQALVGQAEAERDFRKAEWQRYRNLAAEKAVEPEVVDEKQKAYRSAEASLVSTKAGVRRAQSDLEEQKSKRDAAAVEVGLKQAAVAVARADLAAARTAAEFSRIRAPFDGVITRRSVDPGSFVSNASSARAEPFLSVAHTLFVTVVMRVPDNYAPYVTPQTEAVIRMDDLPGQLIRGRVTRFSPSIRSDDRTMRVEVDLFNGTAAEYRRFVAGRAAASLAAFGRYGPGRLAALLFAVRRDWSETVKEGANPIPLIPHPPDHAPPAGARRLLPGMYGSMRLVLRSFADAYLVPSGAVFSLGGKYYMDEIIDGCVRRVPVVVQVNDGRLAKIAVMVREANPRTGTAEVLKDLTGDEEIIVSDQGELGDGQPVKATATAW